MYSKIIYLQRTVHHYAHIKTFTIGSNEP